MIPITNGISMMVKLMFKLLQEMSKFMVHNGDLFSKIVSKDFEMYGCLLKYDYYFLNSRLRSK